MRWGMPILESALTLITETGLYYRGHDVQQLATTCTLEQVAALLWTGEMADATDIFSASQPVQAYLRTLQQFDRDLALLQKPRSPWRWPPQMTWLPTILAMPRRPALAFSSC